MKTIAPTFGTTLPPSAPMKSQPVISDTLFPSSLSCYSVETVTTMAQKCAVDPDQSPTDEGKPSLVAVQSG